MIHKVKKIQKSLLLATLLIYFIVLSSKFNIVYAYEAIPVSIKQNLLTGQFQLAASELQPLAQSGNHEAEYQLAILYLRGKGVELSASKAEDLLLKSATENSDAAFLLGSLYSKGKQLPLNRIEAHKYLTIASSSGNARATRMLQATSQMQSGASQVNSELQNSLLVAIINGDLLEVRRLQRNGVDLDYSDSLGQTPLIIAVKEQQEELVQWFLNQSVKQEKTDKQGNTALHFAASQNQLRSMISLGRNLDNFDALNENRQTPLMLAIINNHQQAAQWLLSNGASPIIKDAFGKTSKDYNRDANLALKFEETNTSSLNAKQFDQQTLRHKMKALQVLSETPNTTYHRWPLLLIAMAQNQSTLAEAILLQGENPWKTNKQGDTAIFFALQNDQSKLLNRMLNNHPINSERSPQTIERIFILAINKNNVNILNKILSVESFSSDSYINKGLQQAIESNNLDVLKILLLKLKKPPNGSLLHQAVRQNQIEVVEVLIENRVPLSWKDSRGRTALFIAAQRSDKNLISLLAKRGKSIDIADERGITPLMATIQNDCLSCAKFFLSLGANPKKQTVDGNTALMFAAQKSGALLQAILQKNDDLSTRNNQSYTALMLAVESKCYDCVQILLEAGAEPKRRNNKGHDSFYLAADDKKLLQMLEQY